MHYIDTETLEQLRKEYPAGYCDRVPCRRNKAFRASFPFGSLSSLLTGRLCFLLRACALCGFEGFPKATVGAVAHLLRYLLQVGCRLLTQQLLGGTDAVICQYPGKAVTHMLLYQTGGLLDGQSQFLGKIRKTHILMVSVFKKFADQKGSVFHRLQLEPALDSFFA